MIAEVAYVAGTPSRLLEHFKDDVSDEASSKFATVANGMYDAVGAMHPSHAEATAELRPAMRTVVSTGVDIGITLIFLPLEEERLAEGSFSIFDWRGYPGYLRRPTGPFRLLDGEEYLAARNAADRANRALHLANPAWDGLEIHEIHPVKFGGSPIDLSNKVALQPGLHRPATTWWRQLQRTLERTF